MVQQKERAEETEIKKIVQVSLLSLFGHDAFVSFWFGMVVVVLALSRTFAKQRNPKGKRWLGRRSWVAEGGKEGIGKEGKCGKGEDFFFFGSNGIGESVDHEVENDSLNGGEYDAHVSSVGSTGEVGVYLSVGVLVEGVELFLHETRGFLVIGTSFVIGEANTEVGPENLLGKEVFLVEEENHSCVGEPLGVDNVFEQLQGLEHTVRFVVLGQFEVVLAHGHHENHRRDLRKAVHPLSSLATLSTNIGHSIGCVLVSFSSSFHWNKSNKKKEREKERECVFACVFWGYLNL